jgi:hypothetical protein
LAAPINPRRFWRPDRLCSGWQTAPHIAANYDLQDIHAAQAAFNAKPEYSKITLVSAIMQRLSTLSILVPEYDAESRSLSAT